MLCPRLFQLLGVTTLYQIKEFRQNLDILEHITHSYVKGGRATCYLKYGASFQVIAKVNMLVGVAFGFGQISAKFCLFEYSSGVLYLSESIDID